MKESCYNYYVKDGGRTIFYNGRTKRFFSFSNESSFKVIKILKEPDMYVNQYGSFLAAMQNEGFIIDDAEDEYKKMMDAYRRSLYDEDYTLMIVPTYKCNLRCWYCYQDHRHQTMARETVNRIKLHIRKYLSENKIRRFHIQWFGGEPLLMFDVILDISSHAKKVCEELGVYMDCNITTNSLLLDKTKIEKLKECNVRFFQITIDGCKEEHNIVKSMPNIDTFSKALNNIVDIVKMMPDTYCILRINLSKKMNDPNRIIYQINEIIPENLRHKVTVDLQRVWQEGESSFASEKLYSISEAAQKSRYSTSTFHHGICYVDYRHHNSIFPDGSVDICDHEGLDNIGRGFLTEKGDIGWSVDLPCFKYSIDNENVVCNRCKHLLLCGGPCPSTRNGLSVEQLKHVCMESGIDDDIEQMIRHVYRTCKRSVSDCSKNKNFDL